MIALCACCLVLLVLANAEARQILGGLILGAFQLAIGLVVLWWCWPAIIKALTGRAI